MPIGFYECFFVPGTLELWAVCALRVQAAQVVDFRSNSPSFGMISIPHNIEAPLHCGFL